MVSKLSIRTSASPRWLQSHWGLRVTQDAYFSLLTHAKQLLLVTFCKNTAGNGASFRTHGRTDGWTADGRTAKGQTDVEVKIVFRYRSYFFGPYLQAYDVSKKSFRNSC